VETRAILIGLETGCLLDAACPSCGGSRPGAATVGA